MLNRMPHSSLSINGDKEEEQEEGKMFYSFLLLEQAIHFKSMADKEGKK